VAAIFDRVEERTAFETAGFDQLGAVMKWAATNVTGLLTVIRPHPAEQPEPWREAFAGMPNVLIVERSDPVAWIAGAELLVVSDCTTGLEAALMNRPCLNISPAGQENWSDKLLMKQVNFTVASAQDAIGPLVEFLTNRSGPIARHRSGGVAFPRTVLCAPPG